MKSDPDSEASSSKESTKKKRTEEPPPFVPVKNLSRADLAIVLQLGETRRVATDDRMWQVPAMSLTALAFLLSALVVADTSWWGRLVAGLVGMAVLYAALVQMLKHRTYEEALSQWLDAIERSHGLPPIHHPAATFLHTDSWDPKSRFVESKFMRSILVDPPAHEVWAWTLLVLLVLDTAFCIVAIAAVACGWG